jgi:LAO/AO transport system ATPase/phenylacetic acid degradation protein PaaD
VTPQALAGRVRRGDRGALARLLSWIDDGLPGAGAALAALADAARADGLRPPHVLGVTGVPGSGKSTLVDALLGAWLARGERIAVLAVDPSSPLTGGAVLGDRVRMGTNGAHANAFVRSFSARGELGGLSRAAPRAVEACASAGFDRIVVETVGTGQSEVAVAALADTRVVVTPPGLGDEVQALKAGTLEIADLLVVSKADLPLAERTARDLREMLHLRRAPAAGAWAPQVLVVSATSTAGLDALLDGIDAHRDALAGSPPGSAEPQHVSSTEADPGVALEADGRLVAGERAAGHRLRSLVAQDGLCRTLGIAFVAGGAGHAAVAMTVDARHLNFHGAGHGGAVFSLADAAFGLASNSHGPVASGIDAHITYEAAVRPGDRLLARASETHRGRRTAVYRIDVVREADRDRPERHVSSFTGTVFIAG